jgi:DNA-binding response OmpR family regulator
VVKINNLLVHPGRHEVLGHDKPVLLTFTEFGILSALVRKPGWVFTRTQLVDEVRGSGHLVPIVQWMCK